MSERPVWAEVDLDAVAANVAALARTAAPADLCAVVKADGYGHGAVQVAQAAMHGGASMVAVALPAEGARLRAGGIGGSILVLAQPSPNEMVVAVANGLEVTIDTIDGARALAAAAEASDRAQSALPVRVHINVDTGMHRVGCVPAEAAKLARWIDEQDCLSLEGLFTHCAVADEVDDPFTDEQLRRFSALREGWRSEGFRAVRCHAANTAATLAHAASRLDLVRCGIGIYGLDPGPGLVAPEPLYPAMALKARVSHVKRVRAGEGISYGLRYRPRTDITVATLPLGYADGVPRRLSSTGGNVLIGGRFRPIAGTITMDQMMVDCGDDHVAVGDEAVLIGRQGDHEISATDWANRLDTITYEIVCGIGPRVPRRYLGGSR